MKRDYLYRFKTIINKKKAPCDSFALARIGKRVKWDGGDLTKGD
jgi:hypothetical protein